MDPSGEDCGMTYKEFNDVIDLKKYITVIEEPKKNMKKSYDPREVLKKFCDQ